MQRNDSVATSPRTQPGIRSGRGPKKAAHAKSGTIAAIGAIILLAAWAGGATLYILFNDQALKYLVERQVSITRSYETQAADLQTEIDRLRSIKLIDQERIDRTVAELARRQNIIETRHSALSGFAETKPGSQNVTVETTGSFPAARPAPPPKPSPLSGTILIAPAAERWTHLESRPLPPLGPVPNARDAETAIEVRLSNLGRDLHRLESAQSIALNELEVAYDGRKRSVLKVLDELGIHASRSGRLTERHTAQAATGGPFLPWTRPSDDPFTRQLGRVRTVAVSLESLEKELAAIPVRRPTSRTSDITSTFGMRLDPFLRQPAMHTGIDFRGETGDPVFAAGAGKIVQAERNGGYGLMVEVDHGNGLTTRYAHLSAIAVSEGAEIVAGQLIGRIGSTGRSTGPHLHYEVRLQGEAADPQRFLRAGLRLEEQL